MELWRFIEEIIRTYPDDVAMFVRLFVALFAGIAIGFERTYRGRPAGVRTHALVCVTSSLLTLITVYESHWVRASAELVRLDPTRMAQGIMTGIGFLGAGVIMKEGSTVRGLTTSASIWITAAIGILAGIGFYFPLAISVCITLGVLSVLRWIEVRLPSEAYYNFDVRGERSDQFNEQAIRKVLAECRFQVAHIGYRLDEKAHDRHYSMILRSTDRSSSLRLSQQLERIDSVYAFRITPISE